ncbi:hypothetical protein GMO_07720 [Gluconobacter morbifer G707]|uniref:Uncharacterized protein n=1 Tax=Gluconobacter morbifer G707 TaxID=1088869 RepID=G6XH07_9PROT|nr:hypothetical protein GMO_07720 [Gluconobacter morbifer G707]
MVRIPDLKGRHCGRKVHGPMDNPDRHRDEGISAIRAFLSPTSRKIHIPATS